MPRSLPVKSKPKKMIRQWLLAAGGQIRIQSAELQQWIHANWFRLLMIGLLTLIFLKKDVRFQLDLQNGAYQVSPNQLQELIKTVPTATTAEVAPVHNPPVLNAKDQQQASYVDRFAKVARKEMTEFGIPASITLAQGLLETNAGTSPLATDHNNHFGLKCFSRSCDKGHCANYSDDSHKDFFRKFTSAWESYRAHSLLLVNSERYEDLFKLPRSDYKGWARGLKEAGYATDKQYARKLVRLIEGLRLYEYDV
ncbi:glycoside hydrolase family 73 protein [Flavilitoribacter nigricans]|uniref:N-acetylmuramidase n=1 Tax=Flavilitoribacter nigricans (strain ATCC 23147 / DSM 23189 / NBRC 102662 / NCIMB 1420 / SS-2) TaxID=1122177 RepID=A0A2D0NCQ4_FLAN2|nr:glucosaminidase domain-containing protein [Flavilitoribacter nigricans]PHN06291.1 N-acetylmuramidase [Flavilitoribacter nigricans DSM 23189 = NBRC 102662]